MNDLHNRPQGASDRAPELELLLTCARWPQTEADRESIRSQAAQAIDWRRFLLLAQHHRLVPLVNHNLQASFVSEPFAGREVLEQLRQQATANTYRTLRGLTELRRVVQEFEGQGISVRVLKGIPLAQSVFGDLSLRAAGDIDLLIEEDAILGADRILRAAGYRGLFEVQRFTPKRFAFYRTHWKDLAYHNPASGFEVDLHWRCFRNSEMPGASLSEVAASETVSFGNFHVSTLPAMENLLYLCVHGTLDGWLYLKSLADVGALVREMSAEQLDGLAELAQGYGILPELSAALILVRRYFTMESWSVSLLGEDDSTVHHILTFAHRALEQGGFLSDRDAIDTGTMMAFEIGLRRNFRYRFELVLRVLFRARMWETIPLPDFLFVFYPLLSPVEWLLFRLRLWRDKPSSTVMISI